MNEKQILLGDNEYKVKQYLPISTKNDIAKIICDSYFDNGKSPTAKEVSLVYCITKYYADYDMEKFDYDEARSSGLYEKIRSNIPTDEWMLLDNLINDTIEIKKEELENIALIIKDFLDKAIQKIPDQKQMKKILKDLPKMINGIDPDKFKFIKEAINFNNPK